MKRVAAEHGLYASFMPKPIHGVCGSGMHSNQSLWDVKRDANAFYDPKDRYGLSAVAKRFMAGQLAHARELAAVVAPTVNSYKRLVPGYEAPVYICWARNNRSALIRVPQTSQRARSATRLELRCPDPSCNPYLAFASMLAAGLDGVERRLEPPKPVEEDVYEFDDSKLRRFYIKGLPGDLGEAMRELAKSRLMREALGPVAHAKLLDAQRRQWEEYRAQVTPWEIDTYYDRL
jgi:glutamine synthetase